MPSPSLALLRSQSDERLVALAQAGHEQAFEAIVRRYRRPLLHHGRRLLQDGEAEDAVQQALLSAWAGLRRGDDVRSLRPWLHTIVHNTALNLLRANGHEHAELSQTLSSGDLPHEELERRLSARRTLSHLAALPERQRTALVGMALEGRSQDEMARALGLSQGALRQLVHRARTALRAAATALTPAPAANWLAAVGARGEAAGGRVAELVAGAGSAGMGATLVKVGVVAVTAGGVAAGPSLVDQPGKGEPLTARPAPAHTAPAPPVASPLDDPGVWSGPAGERRVALGDSGNDSRDRHSRSGSNRSGSSGSGSGSSGSGSDSSGPGSDGSGSGSGSSGSGSSGSGSSGSSSGSGSSGSGSSGSSSGSGSSGSGSGSGSSGSDTLSSGSGSPGSGSSLLGSAAGSGTSGSGSGASGSGTSGSGTTALEPDTSGSGTSGSDTSGSGTSGSG